MNNELITQNAKKSNVSPKEMEDVLHALTIMEKVKRAEIEFATGVLRELAIKSHFSAMGKKYDMNYMTLEQYERIESYKATNEINKILLN